MDDLVKRLRKGCPIETAAGQLVGRTKPNPHEYEAADRIEELEAEVKELEAEVKEAFYDGRDDRIEKERLQAQLDRVKEVRRLLSTQCTNSHAVGLLDEAMKEKSK